MNPDVTGSVLARLRGALASRLRKSVFLAVAGGLVFAGIALAAVQNPSFENDLAGWSAKTIRDDGHNPPGVVKEGEDCASQNGICVITGSDQFTVQDQAADGSATSRNITVTPNDGNKMVRLGGPFTSSSQNQEEDVKQVLSQTFTVDPGNTLLQLNFNVFTWDYSGFDDVEFAVNVTNENGQRISEFHQGAFGQGGDISFKSTGWQPAYVDLAGYEGQQVHLKISSGGTNDNAYGFWSYIDAGLVAQRPVGAPNVTPPTNPETGQPVQTGTHTSASGLSYVTIPNGGGVLDFPAADGFENCMDLPIDVPINPGTNGGTVSNVKLLLKASSTREFTMTDADSNNVWSGTIHCVETGDLYASYTLTEGGASQDYVVPIGGLVLVDPAGVVYDKAVFDQAKAQGKTDDRARAEAAIEGASVRLQRKVGDTFNNVLSGDPGIDPNVNPEVTGPDGRYAWLTSEGTYRVVVSKAGYNTATSREVTVPPEVTDLHVALTKPGGGGGGGGGGGVTTPVGGTPGGGSTNPAAGAKTGPCAGITGTKLAVCRQINKKCGKLKGKKKTICAKRIRATAKCKTMKARTKKQKAKKKACLRKAKKIGAKKKRKS